MPRKVKPCLWKWDLSKLWNPPPFMIVAAMRQRAIGLMLRDLWVAAVGELAEESRR